MDALLLILILLFVFGGGGWWYGNRTWGPNAGFSIVGLILVVFLVLYLFGGLHTVRFR